MAATRRSVALRRMLEEDLLNEFASSIVMAGVLCFCGGVMAWLANRARGIGAAPLWPRIAFGASLGMLVYAVVLVVDGVGSLPGESPAPDDRVGLDDPRDYVR